MRAPVVRVMVGFYPAPTIVEATAFRDGIVPSALGRGAPLVYAGRAHPRRGVWSHAWRTLRRLAGAAHSGTREVRPVLVDLTLMVIAIGAAIVAIVKCECRDCNGR